MAHHDLWNRLQTALGRDYQVLDEIGQGGFAVVYLVRDLKRSADLAVKVMHPELVASQNIVKRFRREAQYVARLDHPNILSVRFAAERDGLVYFAMQKVEGWSLADYLDRYGQMSLEAVERTLGDVSDALEHAHQHGVVHRDIKPSNIMLEHTGRAVVLDFGIAKSLSDSGTSLSSSGQVMGTFAYMSPEQAEGNKKLDHRSDIYSWGVLGFEMLAGRPPYEGPPQVIRHQQLQDRPPDVCTFRPEASQRLSGALRKCLALSPDNRWATIREAATAAGLGQK